MGIRVVRRRHSHKQSYDLGSDHQPPVQGIKCVPRPRGQNPRSGRWPRFAEIYGGHTTMLLNPRPPCFNIPNADLTTHLLSQAPPLGSCPP
ncbi:unnamed protein product [Prunus armeniaca]